MRIQLLLALAALYSAAEPPRAALASAHGTDPVAATAAAAAQLAHAGPWDACLLIERIGSSPEQAPAIIAAAADALRCPVVGWGGSSGAGSPTWASEGPRTPSVQLLAVSGVRLHCRFGVGPLPEGTPAAEAAARGRLLLRDASLPADTIAALVVGPAHWTLWNRAGMAGLRERPGLPMVAIAARNGDWVAGDGRVSDGHLLVAITGPGLRAGIGVAAMRNAFERAAVLDEARAAAAEAVAGMRPLAILAFSGEDRFRLTSLYDPAPERGALAAGAGLMPTGGYAPGVVAAHAGRARGDIDLAVLALGVAP